MVGYSAARRLFGGFLELAEPKGTRRHPHWCGLCDFIRVIMRLSMCLFRIDLLRSADFPKGTATYVFEGSYNIGEDLIHTVNLLLRYIHK